MPRFFVTYKVCQYYLSQVQNVKHRQAVTKLRISAHKLPVETGRYKNIPYNDRICKHCDLNEIGNEQHYLMSCSNTMFRTLRNKFIDNLYMNLVFHISEDGPEIESKHCASFERQALSLHENISCTYSKLDKTRYHSQLTRWLHW